MFTSKPKTTVAICGVLAIAALVYINPTNAMLFHRRTAAGGARDSLAKGAKSGVIAGSKATKVAGLKAPKAPKMRFAKAAVVGPHETRHAKGRKGTITGMQLATHKAHTRAHVRAVLCTPTSPPWLAAPVSAARRRSTDNRHE